MNLIRGKYLAALLSAAVAIPAVLLTPGCTEECVDSFDCRNKGPNGEDFVCVDNSCEAGAPQPDAGVVEEDAGVDAGVTEDAGTDAGTEDAGTDAGTDGGTTDGGA